MIRLLLLRHAKAVPHAEGGDFERGLSERGQQDAARIGRFIARGFMPDLALASDARRTRQTLKAVMRQLETPPARRLDPNLYLASADAILSAIRDAPPDVKTLLVVGHNPGIAELAIALVGAGDPALRRRIESGFPTSALAVVDFDVASLAQTRAGAGSLSAFESAKA